MTKRYGYFVLCEECDPVMKVTCRVYALHLMVPNMASQERIMGYFVGGGGGGGRGEGGGGGRDDAENLAYEETYRRLTREFSFP